MSKLKNEPRWRLLIILLIVGAISGLPGVARGAADPVVTTFTVPDIAPTSLIALATGADGNVWFTEYYINKIGRITPDGTITQFPVPTAKSTPFGITAGPDGNIWYTAAIGLIGRITPTGAVAEFALPSDTGEPGNIVAGPDGNLWFTLPNPFGVGRIGRITTAGAITLFPMASHPFHIVAGADGNLWFIDSDRNTIVRFTTNGTTTDFPILGLQRGSLGALGAAPDGSLWFTYVNGNRISRLTPDGKIATFTTPTGPGSVTAGPDGAMWYTGSAANATSVIGRITAAGEVTEYPIPGVQHSPTDIVAGPPGSNTLWFLIPGIKQVGRIALAPAAPAGPRCFPDAGGQCIGGAFRAQ